MIALDDYTNLNDEFIISADMVFSPYIFILFYHSRLNVKRITKKKPFPENKLVIASSQTTIFTLNEKKMRKKGKTRHC